MKGRFFKKESRLLPDRKDFRKLSLTSLLGVPTPNVVRCEWANPAQGNFPTGKRRARLATDINRDRVRRPPQFSPLPRDGIIASLKQTAIWGLKSICDQRKWTKLTVNRLSSTEAIRTTLIFPATKSLLVERTPTCGGLPDRLSFWRDALEIPLPFSYSSTRNRWGRSQSSV